MKLRKLKANLDKKCRSKEEYWAESRKTKRPSREELLDLVWSKSVIQVAKQFGVVDNAIRKWAKFYHIPVPPVGYWAKFNNGHLKECEEIKKALFKRFNI